MTQHKNVVIVGGGAAGWMAALAMKQALPMGTKITVIESSKIGIVGVGESTNFSFTQMLHFCRVDMLDFIAKTEATIKLGCQFENFGGDGRAIFIPVSALPAIDGSNFLPPHLEHLREGDLMYVNKVANNESLNDFGIAKFALANKVPFTLRDGKPQAIGGIQLHINAGLAAKYLAKLALERGVEHIDAIVQSIQSSDGGMITGFGLDTGESVKADFVFDCSGFHRLIIGKHYNTPWVDYRRYLPVDSAQPFLAQHNDGPVKPYSHFRAHKFGWLWSVPTHSRIGNGYVYDSSGISDEEVERTLREVIDPNGVLPFKPLRFKAGRYEDVWVKNCMALGLSSGFLEPMDGTSLGIAMSQLDILIKNPSLLFTLNEKEIAKVNERIANLSEFSVANVYMHYATGRNDTEFWTRFTVENGPPKFQEWVESWKEHTPKAFEANTGEAHTYAPLAMICNYAGTNLTKAAFVRENAVLNLDTELSYTKKVVEHNVGVALKHCLTQRQLIDLLRQSPVT